jgi:NAD-dependent SIR2 family protein deacetylase
MLSMDSSPVTRLAQWLRAHRHIFVLTGAGCSTASGIPDYRDRDGAWKRRPPVTYQAFTREPLVRARYWARSYLGWPVIDAATPNASHAALAEMESGGRTSMLVTQNVDGLHQRAGNDRVIDLHGRLDLVRCLDCGIRVPRSEVQDDLRSRNPDWADLAATTAPDGDADLEDVDFASFAIPHCPACNGLLKPDVVFFGENVPRERVENARDALQASDAMLVMGSSLMVYSGYRFAHMAHEAGMPLAILTRGVTRADSLAGLKIEADCGATLTAALAEI